MSIEDDILIERFLKKELSENEEKSFLKRLKEDGRLKENFLLEKQLWQTLNDKEWSFVENINSQEIKEYEDLFKSSEAKKIKESILIAEKKYKNSKNIKRIIYSSAAILVLFFSVFMYNSSKQKSLEDLYAYHIEHISIPSVVNRDDNTQYQNLIKAQTLFENKDYQKSIDIFSKELENDNKMSSVYLYLSIAQIETDQFSDAEITLDKLISSDFIDAQKGYWFKSLLYLKSNQLEKLKLELEFIIKNSLFKQKEAKELLKRLESN